MLNFLFPGKFGFIQYKLHKVPTHFLGVLDEISKRGNIRLPKLRLYIPTTEFFKF